MIIKAILAKILKIQSDEINIKYIHKTDFGGMEYFQFK